MNTVAGDENCISNTWCLMRDGQYCVRRSKGVCCILFILCCPHLVSVLTSYAERIQNIRC